MIFAWAASTMTGCAPPDPATQAPAVVKPGKYQIALTGAGLGQLVQAGPGRADAEICVTADQAGTWPNALVKNYLMPHSNYLLETADRVGNRATGKISCALDPQKAVGKLAITYAGTVGEEQTDLDYNLKVTITDAPPDVREAVAQSPAVKDGVDAVARAKRIGAC